MTAPPGEPRSESPEGETTDPCSALLIDFGGVLTSPVVDAFHALSRQAGLAPQAALGALTTHEGARAALVAHEEGRLEDEGFEEAFAAALTEAGGRMAPSGLLARLGRHLSLNEPMIDLVREVRRAGVPVAMVSNSLGRDLYAGVDLDELFDVTVISARVGVRKPSRRIYSIACERLGVDPEQCLLLDDLEHNLVGAARLGIRGIHHRGAPESIARVRECLALPAPPTVSHSVSTTTKDGPDVRSQ